MNTLRESTFTGGESLSLAPPATAPIALPDTLGPDASVQLQRMFRDPRVLEPDERGDLVAQSSQGCRTGAACSRGARDAGHGALRRPAGAGSHGAVARSRASRLPIASSPGSSLASCSCACASATRPPNKPDRRSNWQQTICKRRLARTQAATIRTMRREGIERGGYSSVLPASVRFGRKSGQPRTRSLCWPLPE